MHGEVNEQRGLTTDGGRGPSIQQMMKNLESQAEKLGLNVGEHSEA